MSESFLAGITSPASKQQMEDNLGLAGGWKSDREKVQTAAIEAAKTWRIVRAPERQNGTSKVVAWGNDSNAARNSKERTKKENSRDSTKGTYYKCEKRGHSRKWSSRWKSKEGEKGEKS